MASRNGLNPKIRGLKGVGFNRTLPAPFGFGNGIKPDGSNDYMDVPRLLNFVLPDKITIELWLYKNTAHNAGYLFSIYDDLKVASLNFVTSGGARLLRFDSEAGGLVGQTNWLSFEDGEKAHCVWCIDRIESSSKFYLNGNLIDTRTGIAAAVPNYIKSINFFRFRNGGINSNALMDEFRLYSTTLQADQVLLNYNYGSGSNPCVTEYLLLWYSFEQIEALDFSATLDGSFMADGIRDLSGNNYHGRPVNMDINPASGTFVLNPF